MQSYELAYRMQMEVPGVIDLEGETKKRRKAYGLNQKETAEFGKQCLMARRLVEKGVRFVQIFLRGMGHTTTSSVPMPPVSRAWTNP